MLPRRSSGLRLGRWPLPNEDPALTFFRDVYPTSTRKPTELLQTSVTGNLDDVIPRNNGLVCTVIEAYSKHV